VFSKKYIDDCALIRLDRGGQWEDVACDSALYGYTYICQFGEFYLLDFFCVEFENDYKI